MAERLKRGRKRKLPGKCIEKPGSLSLGKCDPHSAHEGRVEDDGPHLVLRGQVNGGHGADALAVEDDVLW